MKNLIFKRELSFGTIGRIAVIAALCGCAMIAAVVLRTPGSSAAAVNSAPAAAGGGTIYRMKLVRIVDQRSFGQPMTALTLLIPSDWQFQGQVVYGEGTGCHANLVRLAFRAASPDGRLGVDLIPGNTWQWSDDPPTVNMMRRLNLQAAQIGRRGCDIMPTMGAVAYLQQVVLPAVRRGARVIGSEPMPDAARQLQAEAQQRQQVAAQSGMREMVRTDVSRVRIGYALSGQSQEEWFTAMITSVAVSGPNGHGGQTLYYSNSADHVFAMHAPQGELDANDRLFQLILSTVRIDPQWESRVLMVVAQMMAKDASSAAARSAIIAQAGQEQASILHQGFENGVNSREHSMEGWDQYMRGVETYRNPNTGDTVELSNQFGQAWAGPDNQYILSDSPNFDPNSLHQGNYTHLQPASP